MEHVPKTLGKRWSLILKNELARERRQPSKGKGIGWPRKKLLHFAIYETSERKESKEQQQPRREETVPPFEAFVLLPSQNL